MIKAMLPYSILVLSLAMFLFGGAYLGHPLFGMFSVPLILFASLTTLAFFIGVVPSIDDVQVSDNRKTIGSILIVVGSLLLGVVTFYYAKELIPTPGDISAESASFWVANWAARWIVTPLLIGVGAAVKSKWTFRRVVPLVLLFAAPMILMPMLVPPQVVEAAAAAAAVPSPPVLPIGR